MARRCRNPRLRLQRAGGHRCELRRPAARRTGPTDRGRHGCAHPSTGEKPPIGGLWANRAPPRLDSPWSCRYSIAVALGLIAAFSADAAPRRSGDLAAGDIAGDPAGSGQQRRCGDGRPLPPAGHVGSGCQHTAWTPSAARRHPVRQRHDSQDHAVYAPTWGRVKSISRPSSATTSPEQRPAISTTSTARASLMGLPALAARATTASTSAPGTWSRSTRTVRACRVRPAPIRRAGCGPISPRLPRTARSRTGITRATAQGTTAATRPCSRSGTRCKTPRRSSSSRVTATTTSALHRLIATVMWTKPEAFASSWSGRAERSSRAAGLTGPAQRGGTEHHLRGTQAHASPDEL